MKKENPISTLTEILLRMKYDMSKTLSENVAFLNEQTQYYYDKDGYLKVMNGPYNLPAGAVLASKAYPNLKPNEYPKYQFNRTIQSSPKTNEPKKPTTVEEIQEFQDFLDNNFGFWVSIPEKNYYGKLYRRADLGYGNFGPNTNRMWDRQDVKTKWNDYLEMQKIRRTYQKPLQSDVIGPYGSYSAQLGTSKGALAAQAKRFDPEYVQQQKTLAMVNAMYKRDYDFIEKNYKDGYRALMLKYNIPSFNMISPQNFVPTNMNNYEEELSNYASKYNTALQEYYRKNSLVNREQFNSEVEKLKKEKESKIAELDKKYLRTKFDKNTFETYEDKLSLPKDTNISFFKKEDFNNPNTIQNSFYVNGDVVGEPYLDEITVEDLWRFTTREVSGPAYYEKGKGPTMGESHLWIWGAVRGKVKQFTLPPPYDKFIWKKRFFINTDDEYEVSEEYYTIVDNKLTEYKQFAFRDLTWIESWGPLALNGLSIILSWIGSEFPPAYFAAVGLDILAAKIQYDIGDNFGATISALLAFTPLVGITAGGLSKAKTLALAAKFQNAKTAAQVEKIILSLSDEEMRAIDFLKDKKNLDKITSSMKSSGKIAIEKFAENNPLKGQIGKITTRSELIYALGLLIGTWDLSAELEQDEKNRIQRLNDLFTVLSQSNLFTDEEKDILATKEAENIVEESLDELKRRVDTKKKVLQEKQKQIEKEIEQSDNEESIKVLEGMGVFLSDTISFVDTTMGLIELDSYDGKVYQSSLKPTDMDKKLNKKK